MERTMIIRDFVPFVSMMIPTMMVVLAVALTILPL
jgi:hypothetical protein